MLSDIDLLMVDVTSFELYRSAISRKDSYPDQLKSLTRP